MTNTNAQNTATTKTPSKMDLARPIFNEIYAPGYKLSEGVKSQRAEFIKRAQAEIGMTANGAATYFQNLSNQAKGDPLYKYNGKKKAAEQTTEAPTVGEVKTAEDATNATATQAIDAANAQASTGPSNDSDEVTAIGEHRWMVVNAAGEEINSFPSRAKAITAAKELNLDWQDRNDQ
jgi:hypothetical protein